MLSPERIKQRKKRRTFVRRYRERERKRRDLGISPKEKIKIGGPKL